MRVFCSEFSRGRRVQDEDVDEDEGEKEVGGSILVKDGGGEGG